MASSERREAPAVLRLSPPDNIAVALRPVKAGETVILDGVALTIARNIPVGQKLAAREISDGEAILKYGCPIGTAIGAIAAGEHLDAQNVATNYSAASPLPK